MNSANKGFSLVELLIASSVGLIAIGIVGSVFLSGYQAANKRSLELLLQQDVNDAFRLIKEDVLRAVQAAPNATIVATHMDAINHMALSREELKKYVEENNIQDKVEIPEDGALIDF